MTNVLHSSHSNEYYTPPKIVELSREVLGSIDLDPFSCEEANELVKAKNFFDINQDGFNSEWYGNCFVNPPGGSENHTSQISKAFDACYEKCLSGEITCAIFVGFQLSILSTSKYATQCTMFFPRKRLRFWTRYSTMKQNLLDPVSNEDGTIKPDVEIANTLKEIRKLQQYKLDQVHKGDYIRLGSDFLLPSRSPSHYNVIFYIARKNDLNTGRFVKTFSDLEGSFIRQS
jgi:hypothetical protein